MTMKDLIDAYKGDPAELAADDTAIAAAAAKKSDDTLSAADHANRLKIQLANTKVFEKNDDGISATLYTLANGEISFERVPYASSVTLPDPNTTDVPAVPVS
jgi:hypothetical protein